MFTITRKFPDCFPVDCPPGDAKHIDLVLYHLCSCIPPIAKDFMSMYEMGLLSHTRNVCKYGVSFFQNIKEAEATKSMPGPRRMGLNIIVKGKTHIDAGVLKQTPNDSYQSHCTYWFFEDVSRHVLFVTEVTL